MFNGIMWIDVETTGLNPRIHDITQIAIILERDGEALSQRAWLTKPHKGVMVAKEALDVQGTTMKKLRTYPEAKTVFAEFMEEINKRQPPDGKYIIAGYRAQFDLDFMRSWMRRETNSDNIFWQKFYPYCIDVQQNVINAITDKIIEPPANLKLATVAGSLGISNLGMHNAIIDVHAAREVYLEIKRRTIIYVSRLIDEARREKEEEK